MEERKIKIHTTPGQFQTDPLPIRYSVDHPSTSDLNLGNSQIIRLRPQLFPTPAPSPPRPLGATAQREPRPSAKHQVLAAGSGFSASSRLDTPFRMAIQARSKCNSYIIWSLGNSCLIRPRNSSN